jgi:hypothetical protein
MTKTVPTGTTAGVNAVEANHDDGTLLGKAPAKYTELPGLAVTVSTEASNYSPRQTVGLIAVVTNGNISGAGARVNFTLNLPDGTQTVKTITADQNGKAIWNYRTGAKGPLGLYSVIASAAINSQTANSSPASFTVK